MKNLAESQPTKNQVVWNDHGYIEIWVVGKQTKRSVEEMSKQAEELAHTIRAQGKPVLILDNLRRMSKKQPREVPRAVGAEARRLDFDRIALLGSSNILLKYGTNFIIQGLGMTRKMRYFVDQKEAEKWLFSFEHKKKTTVPE